MAIIAGRGIGTGDFEFLLFFTRLQQNVWTLESVLFQHAFEDLFKVLRIGPR